jgi:hypothetical protein
MKWKEIDFRIFGPQIDSLLIAFANTIEREWPAKWKELGHAQLLVMGSVNLSATTYQLVRFLCKDIDQYRDPWQKREFITAVPLLTRSILDSLFTLVFLFDDVPSKAELFVRGGWREMCEATDRAERKHRSKPKWTKYLRERAKSMEAMRKMASLPPPGPETSKLRYWPTPRRMIGWPELSDERRTYLADLNDWYYRELSSTAHLSLQGLLFRSRPLLLHDSEESETSLRKLKANCFPLTICLLLCILSEVQIDAEFTFADRLKYVWRVLREYYDQIEEIYQMRYDSRL